MNENYHHRGLHILVVDPSDSKNNKAHIFDTYQTSSALERFIADKENVPEGYFLAAACQDECVTKLSTKAK